MGLVVDEREERNQQCHNGDDAVVYSLFLHDGAPYFPLVVLTAVAPSVFVKNGR